MSHSINFQSVLKVAGVLGLFLLAIWTFWAGQVDRAPGTSDEKRGSKGRAHSSAAPSTAHRAGEEINNELPKQRDPGFHIVRQSIDLRSCMLTELATGELDLSQPRIDSINSLISEALITVRDKEMASVSTSLAADGTCHVMFTKDFTPEETIARLKTAITDEASPGVADAIVQALLKTNSFRAHKAGYMVAIRNTGDRYEFRFGDLIDPAQFGDGVVMASRGKAIEGWDNFASMMNLAGDKMHQYPRWSHYVRLLEIRD